LSFSLLKFQSTAAS